MGLFAIALGVKELTRGGKHSRLSLKGVQQLYSSYNNMIITLTGAGGGEAAAGSCVKKTTLHVLPDL